MMHPADVAIARPPLGHHQFGSKDLVDASSIWGTGGSMMVANQDYGEDWKNLPVPSVQGAHCSSSNVWLCIIMQQYYSL
jgi:hypothetical protein